MALFDKVKTRELNPWYGTGNLTDLNTRVGQELQNPWSTFDQYQAGGMGGTTPDTSLTNNLNTQGRQLQPGLNQAQDYFGGVMSGEVVPNEGLDMQQVAMMADNPYMTGMVDAASRDVTRNLYENQMPGIAAYGAGSGNLGSSRRGMAEGIAERGAADRVADIGAQLRGNAYQQALGLEGNRAAQNAGYEMNAAGNVGNLGKYGMDLQNQARTNFMGDQALPTEQLRSLYDMIVPQEIAFGTEETVEEFSPEMLAAMMAMGRYGPGGEGGGLGGMIGDVGGLIGDVWQGGSDIVSGVGDLLGLGDGGGGGGGTTTGTPGFNPNPNSPTPVNDDRGGGFGGGFQIPPVEVYNNEPSQPAPSGGDVVPTGGNVTGAPVAPTTEPPPSTVPGTTQAGPGGGVNIPIPNIGGQMPSITGGDVMQGPGPQGGGGGGTSPGTPGAPSSAPGGGGGTAPPGTRETFWGTDRPDTQTEFRGVQAAAPLWNQALDSDSPAVGDGQEFADNLADTYRDTFQNAMAEGAPSEDVADRIAHREMYKTARELLGDEEFRKVFGDKIADRMEEADRLEKLKADAKQDFGPMNTFDYQLGSFQMPDISSLIAGAMGSGAGGMGGGLNWDIPTGFTGTTRIEEGSMGGAGTG